MTPRRAIELYKVVVDRVAYFHFRVFRAFRGPTNGAKNLRRAGTRPFVRRRTRIIRDPSRHLWFKTKRLRMAATWAFCCASASSAGATPQVTDSSTQMVVSNGITTIVVDKLNGGLKSLKLGNQELVGGGLVYFDANVADFGGASNSDYWRIGRTNPASYSFATGVDFVDVAVSHSATALMPFDVTQHFVLRDGETGFHVYANFEHTAAMQPKSLVQTRLVMRGDKNIFDHHSVTDDRFGVMPTPSELAAGTKVQDATTRLNPGTAYESETGKDVYTKYDWSLDNESLEVTGFYGSQFGAWMVQPNLETHAGGPPKQHLTVHQTETTPVLLGMLASTHYGTSKQLDFAGDMQRSFGPFYVHLNTGPNHAIMRNNAKTFADVNVHQAFYDTLDVPGWTPTADRATVNGRLQFAAGLAADGATIILSDNNTDFQFSEQGRQYWTTAGADGEFDLTGVSPGKYRMTAYAPGVFGEFIIDDVTVATGSTLELGNLNWQPPDRGVDLWQIGAFDRSAEEFRYGAGDEFRQWGLWQNYPADFPSGVEFVVGQSTEAVDWNFAHWESAQQDWQIEFDVDSVPADKMATLTIAAAGQRGGRMRAFLNGDFIGIWLMPHDGSILHRSGIRGAYQATEMSFSSDLFVEGTNLLTLEHIGANLSPSNTEGILYDALRLEIDLLPADFDRDQRVSGRDILLWQRGFGLQDGALQRDGDADYDGDVDDDDLAIWRRTFGEAVGPLASTFHHSVPESASLAIAALGFFHAWFWARGR